MGVTFAETPEVFGSLHLWIVAGILACLIGLGFVLKNWSEKRLLRLIGILGVLMIVTEIWKQWFVWVYVYEGERSTWFFPWQLCSMSMYVSALVPVLKGKAQNTALVFLATFSVIGAVFALGFPGDMMRPQILLFIHSFWYHGTMLLESLAATFVLRNREKVRFVPAICWFLVMAVIAQIINVVSYRVIGDTRLSSNMFQITPYYPSTQPVFHEIALAIGVWPEIILYLGCIIFGGFLLFQLLRIIIARHTRVNQERLDK
ncbi:MAG: YwaF family protein [Lachnospiraceae bacterium]|nr:YwaF family protein [Lachnospiraceae bacterium]